MKQRSRSNPANINSRSDPRKFMPIVLLKMTSPRSNHLARKMKSPRSNHLQPREHLKSQHLKSQHLKSQHLKSRPRKVKKLVYSALLSTILSKLVCIFVSSKINYNSTCVSYMLSLSDYCCTKNSVIVMKTSRGVTNNTRSALLRT